MVFHETGNYDKAKEFYEKALAIRKQSLARNQVEVPRSLSSLGNVLEKTGNYDKAIEFHEKALEFQKQSLGPNHIDVAASLNNIGLLYDKTGKQHKAIKFFEKSLEVRKLNVLGEDLTHVTASFRKFRTMHEETEKYESQKTQSKFPVPSHAHVSRSSNYFEITSGDDATAKDVGNSPGVENINQELVLQEWKYIDESTKHRELFLKLIEYGRNSGVEVKEVGNVRVIFSKEFCIGEGSGATRVYLGLGKDGYGKAVKRIHQDRYKELAQQEKEILNQFNAKKSKYVVNYSFLEEDTGTEYVYLILDLCEESLESYVKSTLEDLQKALPKILRQILLGLADLHNAPNPILHRDLKPTNVLRDTQHNFLIADFGISRILENDSTTYKSSPNMGTEYWIAPESYCEDEDTFHTGRYKKQSDVYNAGMVAYYIATEGKHPFGKKRLRLDNMLKGNPVGLDEIKDETLKDLLSWMLNLKPENRPSATVALKHPFLLSDGEKFDLLCKVGNLPQIKTNDPLCSVVQQLNSESSDWRSQMDSDVYDYLVNKRTYKSSWTECLRLIRNIDLHWKDLTKRKRKPEPFYKIGDYRAYFLRTFPNLPVRVHAAVRSNEEWKNDKGLEKFFNFTES
ncbi:serine/threonine-protein kinase/endoribonuclease IRE1-like [Xenia sp. Carnegie-2017]|uniref:serine/threonine-protein kinase/endoribonuclease IRE1-like n=1 Tax=Xenia sp. Carnegie-2017 TaxID=2897299 RepID=UPI001F035FD4|nr:serine/threonine-protein kinase/endoribonuclease IRE1-like [Xenia sp. Carnegie-2017]